MIIQAIIIFVSILFGYLLRDNNIKALHKRNKHLVEELKDKLKPRKSEILEYQQPKTENETAFEEGKRNMGL